MSRSKEKGTGFERMVADYLSEKLGGGIERRALQGSKDKGDIIGVSFMGGEVVIECKNRKRMELSEWLDEAGAEAGNAGAPYWAVVHKRRSCGEKSFGETYVTTTLGNFARALSQGSGKP